MRPSTTPLQNLQPGEGRRAVPVKRHCDRLATVQHVEAAQSAEQRVANLFFGQVILVERKLRRDYADVAHRHRIVGAMNMVLPLTWTVYWEAPMTVARMRALGSIISRPKSPHAPVHLLGDQRARSPKLVLPRL